MQICLQVFEIRFITVTWPRPRPFSGFFFAGFWDIAPLHLCTKFQVSNSTRFEYTLGGTPKILGSRDLDHAPFLNFSLRVFEILPLCTMCTKFQVSNSTRFGDTLGCTPKFWGVTWPRPRPYSRFFFWVFEISPPRICIPNLKTVALLVLEIR